MRPLRRLWVLPLVASALARADEPPVTAPPATTPAAAPSPAAPAASGSAIPPEAPPDVVGDSASPFAEPISTPTFGADPRWYRRRRTRPATDQDRLGWAVPDYLMVQTGGYLGMFVAGLGYAPVLLKDGLHLDLRFGYTPPYRGAPAVRESSLFITVRPLRLDMGETQRYRWHPLYVGGGAMVVSSSTTFRSQPAIYPKGYYAPNGIQFLALLGTEFSFQLDDPGVIRRHGFFAELITVNQYLDAILQNPDLPLLDAFSVSFGYRMSL